MSIRSQRVGHDGCNLACITESLCGITETDTTLQINYSPIKTNLKKHSNLKPGSLAPGPVLLTLVVAVQPSWDLSASPPRPSKAMTLWSPCLQSPARFLIWREPLKESSGTAELSPPQLDAEVPAGLVEGPGRSKQQGGQSRSWDGLG